MAKEDNEATHRVGYESCDSCQRHRDDGDLQSALKCRLCGGTGIVAIGPVCNGCGESLYPPRGDMNAQSAYGLENVSIQGAYGSTGLLDMHRYTFSLCETCIRTKILMTCKIPPKTEEIGAGWLSWKQIDFASDQELWEYEEWRRSGGHATASIHRICNATIACGKQAEYSVAFSDHVGDDCLCLDHKDRFKNCLNAKVVPFVPMNKRSMENETRSH